MPDGPLILYHSGCADGFCAAWAAWRHFKDDAEYRPVNYGDSAPYPRELQGRDRDVYCLDFSFKREQTEYLCRVARTVVVLDHHPTMHRELLDLKAPNFHPTYKPDCSGGSIAWEEFAAPGEPPPWLVLYTEDRDLWRFKLPHSREVSAWLQSQQPWSFAQWEDWHTRFEGPDHHWIDQGRAILRYQAAVIRKHVEAAQEVELFGYRILAANATTNISEIAGELAKGRPFGATYFVGPDGRKVWSLRSDGDGLDVSELAARKGGGGHKHAAGFTEVRP